MPLVSLLSSSLPTLKSKLEQILDCDTHDDELVLQYYSVDASSYKIKPKIVVFPKNENDIIKLVKFANKNNISITARGAGTGLVGSALGDQIILDFKNMNKIKINKNNSVTVQPGVIKGVLDEKLAKQHYFFAPNPSVGKYCSIGGMIGTNASGSHAIKYGSTIDNLLEVTIIDGTGKKIVLPGQSKTSKQIFEISNQIISKKYPSVSKNSCGYRLDSVTDIKQTHKVIAGSEGTLGLIISAKFRIRKKPKQKALYIITYESTRNIDKDLINILKLKPSAVEYLDSYTIKNIKYKFAKNIKLLLFVELDTLQTKTKQKQKDIPTMADIDTLYGKIELQIKKSDQIEKWWLYRNSALAYTLRTISQSKLVPHIIEDCAVPIEKFRYIFPIIKKINNKYKTKSIIYGHAANANLHIRLIATKQHSSSTIKKVSAEFFDEIFALQGTITAEHGDGLARSEFVKKQYGSKNYTLFKELKKTLDPKGILNPNKIISKHSQITRNLQY